MLAKFYRIFCGEYIADPQVLQDKKVQYFSIRKPAYLVVDETVHGHARIKGMVKKLGVVVPFCDIAAYSRETKQLIWTTRSGVDGAYELFNIKAGLDCFVVAIDKNREYNAVISDGVVAK